MIISTKPYLNNIQRTLNKEAFYKPEKNYSYKFLREEIIRELRFIDEHVPFNVINLIIKYVKMFEEIYLLGDYVYCDSEEKHFINHIDICFENYTIVWNLVSNKVECIENEKEVENPLVKFITENLNTQPNENQIMSNKKKVYKYIVTYRSKPFYCEETGNNIYLETGCYKWVEEDTTETEVIKYMSISDAKKATFKTGYDKY